MDVPTTPAAHAAHDEVLLAAFAAGDDLALDEAARATALAADCPHCAAVVSDIRGLMAATAALPAPARARDFRLSDADAARLRPAGWRGLVAAFGDARLAFTRPLAAGLVTIGFAGLLVAIAPGVLAPAGGSGSFSMAEAPVPTTAGALQAPAVAAPDASAAPESVTGDAAVGADNAAGPAGAGIPVTTPGLTFGIESALPPDGAAGAVGPQDGGPAATGADRAAADASPAPKAGGAAVAPASEPPVPSVATFSVETEASVSSGPDPVTVIAAVSAALLALGALLFVLRSAGRRILEPVTRR
jgi:hypothetical protein